MKKIILAFASIVLLSFNAISQMSIPNSTKIKGQTSVATIQTQSAINNAAKRTTTTKANDLIKLLTSKLLLKGDQISKMTDLVSKLDLTKLTDPKSQISALINKFRSSLSFLDNLQLSKLLELAK